MRPFTKTGEIPIYIFENHAQVIVPWARERQRIDNAPELITFDAHTDTMKPFLRWAYWEAHRLKGKEDNTLTDELMHERITSFDYSDDFSLNSAADDLWHDEHICAALDGGIISKAHVVAYQSPGKSQLRSDIVYYPNGCHYKCVKSCHDNQCLREHADLAIDDGQLAALFEINLDVACTTVFQKPYILDIDLDFFNTIASLKPKSCELFKAIARDAIAITVVTEPACFQERCCDEGFDWGQALKLLMDILTR